MTDDISDAELMQRLSHGDDLALNTIILRWRAKLAAFLLRMTGNHASALDLTQETFVRLYHARKRYRPSGTFTAYIFRIAANLARDHSKWMRRHPSITLDETTASNIPAAGPWPDQATESNEAVIEIEAAISSLPTDLREALILFVYEYLSYQSIATIAGCSPKAIETRIYRAKQLLRGRLEPNNKF